MCLPLENEILLVFGCLESFFLSQTSCTPQLVIPLWRELVSLHPLLFPTKKCPLPLNTLVFLLLIHDSFSLPAPFFGTGNQGQVLWALLNEFPSLRNETCSNTSMCVWHSCYRSCCQKSHNYSFHIFFKYSADTGCVWSVSGFWVFSTHQRWYSFGCCPSTESVLTSPWQSVSPVSLTCQWHTVLSASM